MPGQPLEESAQVPVPPAPGSWRFRARVLLPWLSACSLVLITLAAYAPARNAGFVWDDDLHITGNMSLRNLSGLRRIWFQRHATPQYYPLVHTTFWLEYHLWGPNPFGYHVVNVLLHAGNALLLWRVLRRLEVPGALLAAALFALHPVHVESVAWITERKNVLSTLCYLGSALALLRFWPPEEADPQPLGRWRYYVLALVLFAAALFSKTVACSLPAAFLLVRWWKQGGVSRRDLLVSAPLFALGLVLGLHTAYLEREYVGARGPEWDFSPVERVLIAGRAIWFYASKLLWPVPLMFTYPRWQINASSVWQYGFPFVALILVVLLYLLRRPLGRGPLTAVLFFGGTLAPALGFFNVYAMRFSFVADHFQYLASAGLLALFAAGMAWALSNRRPTTRYFGRVLCVFLIGILAALTWQQAEAYQDSITLWTDTLTKNPSAWIAYTNRGKAYVESGQLQPALDDCTRALELKPDLPEAFSTRGLIHLRMGHAQLALDDCTRAIELRPDLVEAYNTRGRVYVQLGYAQNAINDYTYVIKVKPDVAVAYVNRGNVYLLQGHLQEALFDYSDAIELDPELADAYGNRAMVYLLQERFERARDDYARALELNPNAPNIYFGRARLHYTLKEYGEAWSDVRRAEELGGRADPKFLRQLSEASGRPK